MKLEIKSFTTEILKAGMDTNGEDLPKSFDRQAKLLFYNMALEPSRLTYLELLLPNQTDLYHQIVIQNKSFQETQLRTIKSKNLQKTLDQQTAHQ